MNIIDELLNALFNPEVSFVSWYFTQMDIFNPLRALLLIIVKFLLIQLILAVFPFIRNILNGLCAPFRLIHVHAHLQKAAELSKETRRNSTVQDSIQDYVGIPRRKVDVSAYYSVSVTRSDEYTSTSIRPNKLDDITKIAMAPMKPAMIMFVIYVLTMPIMSLMGVVGLVIQLYLSLVIFGVLMPSSADMKVIINVLLTMGVIPARYIYYTFVVFYIVLLNETWRTGDAVYAVMAAAIVSFVYLVILFYLIKSWAKEVKMKYPILIEDRMKVDKYRLDQQLFNDEEEEDIEDLEDELI